MKLLGKRLLIQKEKPIEQTKSGIYIPETAQEKRNIGRVILLGSEADSQFDNKTVLFNPNIGIPFTNDDVSSIMIHELDVIAILD